MEDPEFAAIIDMVLDQWEALRPESERFRTWLMDTLPAQAGAGPDDHSYMVFEVVSALIELDRPADALTLMRWLGLKYAGVDPGVAVRVIMASTDYCTHLGLLGQETNIQAMMVLRDVCAEVTSKDVHVERAVCRALVQIAFLRGEVFSPQAGKQDDLAALWTDIAARWRGSTDPELRGRAAQALWNRAMLWLQLDREQTARQDIADLLTSLPDTGDWVTRGRHGLALLDRLTIPPADVKTGYLESQRRSDIRLGLTNNHMPEIVRLAQEHHATSAGRVRSWVCAGEPFVLLLRNFELTERSGDTDAKWLLEDPEAAHVRVIRFGHTQNVLTEFVNGVSLVQVANTAAGELEVTPWGGQFVPPTRLYLPDATWFETVTMLMPFAERVIVWAEVLTPPLARELAALREQGRTGDTLVILEDPARDPAEQVYLPTPKHEPLTADHPVLAGFPHVVDADRFKGKHAWECAELQALVADLDAARALPAEHRFPRLLSRLDQA